MQISHVMKSFRLPPVVNYFRLLDYFPTQRTVVCLLFSSGFIITIISQSNTVILEWDLIRCFGFVIFVFFFLVADSDESSPTATKREPINPKT